MSLYSPEHDKTTRPQVRTCPLSLAMILLLVVVVPTMGLLLAACAKEDGGPTPSPSLAVAATVNGRPVHRDRVDAVVAESRLAGKEIGDEAAVQAAIDEELVRQEAERLGIAATEKSVNERVKALESSVGGSEALEEALAGAGLTREQLRERLAVVVLGERVAAAKFQDMSVGRGRSRAYYRRNPALFTSPAEVKLGDINCKTDRLARAAIDKIARGQSFHATARQFSTDPELKQVGGQLGWLSVDSLPGPMARAVAALEPGEVSASPLIFNGFHVLKVYGRRPERVTPFAAVDRQIRATLLARDRDSALKDWLKNARAAARVEVAP